MDKKSGMEIEEVAVDKLRTRVSLRTSGAGDVNFGDLVRSLKEHGQLYPLLVTSDLYVVDGQRRLRALKEAGSVKARVVFVPVSAEKETKMIGLVANLHRADLNDLEVARAYRWLLDQLGVTQAALSKLLGLRPGRITSALHLLDAPDFVQESLEKGKIAKRTAAKVGKVTKEAVDTKKLSGLVPSADLPDHIVACRVWKGDRREWEVTLHGTGSLKKFLSPMLAAELDKLGSKTRKSLG